MKRFPLALLAALVIGAVQAQSLTIYASRGEGLVQPIIKQFEKDTGIQVKLRFGPDAEILAALQEEGSRSPADLFWANSSGSLEAATKAGLLLKLPPELLSRPSEFVPSSGLWVPVSVRFRVLAYNPSKIKPSELPASVMDLPQIAKLKGRIGWTPTYSSFQDFITAMRALKGEAATKAWLLAMKAAGAKAYANNPAMLDAMRAGEIDVGLSNHYYIQRLLAGIQEGEYEGKEEDQVKTPTSSNPAAKANVATYYFSKGDVGSLALVTGAAVLKTSKQPALAEKFLNYLLEAKSQQFTVDQVREYPVVSGIKLPASLLPFTEVVGRSPKLDFSKLTDLDGTLKLLREVGLL
ncbi:MAG: iron ABC transporter substrate-binding protein [Thermaceae bacterium]|nr:iron ABC transporter substrate-binding protein [Thermaceae bacterium]